MESPLRSAPAELLDACLVVEDDSIIRLDLEETLRGFGLKRVHGAGTLDAGLELASVANISFAVLDFNLGRADTVPIAMALAARGIPVVFLTAYGTAMELPPALAHLEVIAKPFSSDLLAEALLKAFAVAARQKAAGLACSDLVD